MKVLVVHKTIFNVFKRFIMPPGQLVRTEIDGLDLIQEDDLKPPDADGGTSFFSGVDQGIDFHNLIRHVTLTALIYTPSHYLP